MKDGKDPVVIPQDPSNKNSIPILRSVNQRDGIEFTWSVWLYIKDIKPEGQVKHIFHKGNSGITNNSEHEHVQDGMNFPNNGPGMYIDSGKNELIVVTRSTTSAFNTKQFLTFRGGFLQKNFQIPF